MKILKKHYWVIIPIILAIVLFTTPIWLEWLWMYSDKKFIKEQRQNTSLVDYSTPFHLKTRKIIVSDLSKMIQEEPFGTSGEVVYHPKNLKETEYLLDSLKGMKIDLTVELTLNSKVDSLNQQEKIQLRQKAIELVGFENISKATHVKFVVFKETDYTIKKELKYPLKIDDEYAVLLDLIELK